MPPGIGVLLQQANLFGTFASLSTCFFSASVPEQGRECECRGDEEAREEAVVEGEEAEAEEQPLGYEFRWTSLLETCQCRSQELVVIGQTMLCGVMASNRHRKHGLNVFPIIRLLPPRPRVQGVP